MVLNPALLEYLCLAVLVMYVCASGLERMATVRLSIVCGSNHSDNSACVFKVYFKTVTVNIYLSAYL